MNRFTLAEFVNKTKQQDLNQGVFELEAPSMLEVNLNGQVWTKLGAMVAYTGEVKFVRQGILEQGLGTLLKKTVSGEGLTLTSATGCGKVYLADKGKRVTILQLANEAIFVNGNDVLAFEPTLTYKITMMRKMAAILSGGLFSVRLEGTGMVAITTHFEPMTLRVRPDQPVMTDPNATIVWSGNLAPEFKTDVSFKTFLGRGSGESIQMLFRGDGFVVIQPYEEVYMQRS